MLDLATGVAICPWDGVDPLTEMNRAEDMLELARPQIVIIHGHPPELLEHGPAASERVRGWLPLAEIWWQIAGDYRFNKAPEIWPPAIKAAAEAGAAAIVLNAEPYWFRQHALAIESMEAAHVAANEASIVLLHSSFDLPCWVGWGGHPDYPWEEFCGPLGAPSITQHYSVGDGAEKGWIAPKGHLTRRFVAGIESWKKAEKEYGTQPLAGGYLQPYSTHRGDLCAAGVRLERVAFWASLSRVDMHGSQAMRALSGLHQRGYWGMDENDPDGFNAIQRFQRDFELEPDGDVGPATLQMLGIDPGR